MFCHRRGGTNRFIEHTEQAGQQFNDCNGR